MDVIQQTAISEKLTFFLNPIKWSPPSTTPQATHFCGHNEQKEAECHKPLAVAQVKKYEMNYEGWSLTIRVRF